MYRAFFILNQFLKLSYKHSFVILIGSFIIGFLQSMTILALFPLTHLLGMVQENSKVNLYFEKIINFFKIDNSLILVLSFMVIFVIIIAIITYLIEIYKNNVAQEIASQLRKKMINSAINARWKYFIKKKPGELVYSTVEEPSKSLGGYIDTIEFFSFSIQAIVYIITALFISLIATSYTILAGLFLILILLRWNEKARIAGKVSNEQIKLIMSNAINIYSTIKVFKSMGKENFLIKSIGNQISKLKKYEFEANIVILTPKIWREPLIFILLSLALYLVFTYDLVDKASIIPVTFLYLRTIQKIGEVQGKFHTIMKVQPLYESYQNNQKSAENNLEIFESSKEVSNFNNIEIQNLSFSYNDKIILKDINISFNKGTFNLIIGQSGSGKTTLLDLICALHLPNKGSININGENILNLNVTSWRKSIGYVMQESYFFNDTLRNNLILGREDIDDKRIYETLNLVNASFVNDLDNKLNTMIGEQGLALSGGQRQRLALSRALLHTKNLLILDEATSALDDTNEMNILKNLKKLTNNNFTIIFASHHKKITNFADNIYEIEDGWLKTIEKS